MALCHLYTGDNMITENIELSTHNGEIWITITGSLVIKCKEITRHNDTFICFYGFGIDVATFRISENVNVTINEYAKIRIEPSIYLNTIRYVVDGE